MMTQLRFATLALFAAAMALAASSISSARAFTMENLSTNGGNTTRFADPNDRVKNFDNQGSRPFGPNGPVVQFGAGAGSSPYRPFNHGYAPPQPLVGGGN